MNPLLRSLAIVPDSLVYGVTHGVVKFLMRSEKPLDPDRTWRFITRDLPTWQDHLRLNYPPKWIRPLLLRRLLRAPHHWGIAQHYDVSNDFYELFLDKKYMLYTCADFRTGHETLEEAQTNKVEFIMNLLDPRPGETILELGCGWGGMLQEVFNRTGERDNLYGYTLSREQIRYNDEHRGFHVEFKNFITDPLPRKTFDKIFSIGCWEHVRRADLRPALENLYGALKPGGRMVTHFFCPLERHMLVAALVGQLFFPGTVIPPYPIQIRTAQQVGFRVMHQSIHDTYGDTVREWFNRLVANRDRAIELVGVQTYNKYLLFFPCSWKYFHDVQAMLVRIVFQKPPIA